MIMAFLRNVNQEVEIVYGRLLVPLLTDIGTSSRLDTYPGLQVDKSSVTTVTWNCPLPLLKIQQKRRIFL